MPYEYCFDPSNLIIAWLENTHTNHPSNTKYRLHAITAVVQCTRFGFTKSDLVLFRPAVYSATPSDIIIQIFSRTHARECRELLKTETLPVLLEDIAE